jgi:trehalose 6-phosphate synthase/phosphatase
MDTLNECLVFFSLIDAPPEVYIVGNCEALGNWIPSQGVRLTSIGSSSTTLIPIKLLKGSKLEYKYVKQSSSLIWESIPNRKLTLKDNLHIEDSFNSPRSSLDYSQKRFELLRRDSSEQKLEKLGNDSKSLIIVSMLLPFRLVKAGCYSLVPRSSSWHFQLFSACSELFDLQWVGFLGEVPVEDQEEVIALLKNYSCVPVFLPGETLKHHRSYCESILFHVLNNQIDLKSPVSAEKNNQQWEGYKMMNILFNETLFSVYAGQMVWVHGSELLLLPSLISKKVKDPVNIGFYFHRPFPSSEIFRILPHKNAILNAIGCCDVIGFQIFEHATHFIGTCKRILGVDTSTSKDGKIYLNYFGRNINVYIGHIGICPKLIENIRESKEYLLAKSRLSERFSGKTLILSIDQLSPLSGFFLKLRAIDQLAATKSKTLKNVVFLNILIENSEETSIDTGSIDENSQFLVNQINSRAGRGLVELEFRNISQEERLAYMEVSSGLIVSTIREGMNLLPFEYLHLKKFKNSGIVLSEFAGSSNLLSSPYKVNPLDINSFEIEIRNLINHLPQKRVLDKDLLYIKERTTVFWARDFVTQIKACKKKTYKFQYVSIGMNDTLRLMAIPKNFSKLDEFEVLSAYKKSKNRALFFDVEGTLLTYFKEKETYMPSHKVLAALEDLCSDPKNTVMTITGRERATQNKWFGTVPGLSLAAEYGAFVKHRTEDWQCTHPVPGTWKELAKKVIESHVERIEGAYVTCKETSVIFDYREADALFGQWQAKDIVSHLERLLHDHECQVVSGEGFVEVRPRGIDKGTTLYRTLKDVHQNKGPVDFVFTIGDDESDEKMFKMLKTMKKKSCEILSHDAKTFTCTFGVKPSEALFYFLNADEVLKLMELLATGYSKRRHSLGNLHPRHSNHQFTAINVSDLTRLKRHADSRDYSDYFSVNFDD